MMHSTFLILDIEVQFSQVTEENNRDTEYEMIIEEKDISDLNSGWRDFPLHQDFRLSLYHFSHQNVH